MVDRKHTPDVLADLLGGGPVEEAAGIVPAIAERTKPAARTQKHPTSEPKPVRTSRPQPAAVPARWEHRVASFQQNKGWRLRFLDGSLVKDWASGPLVHEYIQTLAAEGWQVAGVCSGEALFGLMDKYQVYFKRPA